MGDGDSIVEDEGYDGNDKPEEEEVGEHANCDGGEDEEGVGAPFEAHGGFVLAIDRWHFEYNFFFWWSCAGIRTKERSDFILEDLNATYSSFLLLRFEHLYKIAWGTQIDAVE